MELESTPSNSSNSLRQRSSRRLRHEAQAKVFERQTGSLEKIRLKLGLRPSQISEVLKVHPSAWTRWTRTGKAPPHVFQMLEWYMELLQWRGQYQTPKESVLTKLNRENPEVYVPAEPPRSVAVVEPDHGGASAVSKKTVRLLIIIWGIQALLWAGALWFVWARFNVR